MSPVPTRPVFKRKSTYWEITNWDMLDMLSVVDVQNGMLSGNA